MLEKKVKNVTSFLKELSKSCFQEELWTVFRLFFSSFHLPAILTSDLQDSTQEKRIQPRLDGRRAASFLPKNVTSQMSLLHRLDYGSFHYFFQNLRVERGDTDPAVFNWFIFTLGKKGERWSRAFGLWDSSVTKSSWNSSSFSHRRGCEWELEPGVEQSSWLLLAKSGGV